MRAGEFDEGECVLRARIDMASGNINLRDPVLYRILRARHPRTGDTWCIYPTYDFAHGQSDAIEGVTHSLCTLEFADHRPLYDWLIDNLPVPNRPRQYEFARLNLAHTVLSKRRLVRLVEEGHVAGWDDPRMPTLAGLRRRGVPPAAIRDFVRRVGVARADNLVDPALLDHCIRDELNSTAERRLAVLRPLKVAIENYPDGETEMLTAPNNPNDPGAGSREIPFSREIWVERDDFMEDPSRRFHRLRPGREVRLRYAYFITCVGVEKDADGEPVLLRCTYDPETRGGDAPDGRRVRGTIHWVSAAHAMPAEIRLYDHLFSVPEPGAEGDFLDDVNPGSLVVLKDCRLEPSLAPARRCAGAVRAPGLFPPGRRIAPWPPGLQPGRGAPRFRGRRSRQRGGDGEDTRLFPRQDRTDHRGRERHRPGDGGDLRPRGRQYRRLRYRRRRRARDGGRQERNRRRRRRDRPPRRRCDGGRRDRGLRRHRFPVQQRRRGGAATRPSSTSTRRSGERPTRSTWTAPSTPCRPPSPTCWSGGAGLSSTWRAWPTAAAAPAIPSTTPSAKGAVVTMTMGVAREFADKGIRALSISPGPIDTPFQAAAATSPELAQRMLEDVPMKRFGTPEEIGELVLFLCSDACRFMTADTVYASGGGGWR